MRWKGPADHLRDADPDHEDHHQDEEIRRNGEELPGLPYAAQVSHRD